MNIREAQYSKVSFSIYSNAVNNINGISVIRHNISNCFDFLVSFSCVWHKGQKERVSILLYRYHLVSGFISFDSFLMSQNLLLQLGQIFFSMYFVFYLTFCFIVVYDRPLRHSFILNFYSVLHFYKVSTQLG